MIMVCDNLDGKEKKRRLLFSKWYSVYNEYNNKKASIYLVITIVVLLLTGSSILSPIFVLMLYKNTPQFEILNSSSSYQSVSGK